MSLTTHIQLSNDSQDALMRASLIQTTLSFVEAGCTGPSADLDGSVWAEYDVEGSYLSNPDLTDALSMACRFLTRQLSEGYIVATGGQTAQDIGLAFSIYQGRFRAHIKNSTELWNLQSPILETNVSYSVFVRCDGTVAELYLDGTLVDIVVTPITHSTSNVRTDLTVGRSNNKMDHFFNGLIEDIRFYDHYVSLKDIQRYTQAMVMDLDMSLPGETTNQLIVRDRSRLENDVSFPKSLGPTYRFSNDVRRGLFFTNHTLPVTYPIRSGNFTWMIWCNFDANNQIVIDAAVAGNTNYYAALFQVHGGLTITVHNHNDIRILDHNGSILWKANSETQYLSGPFTWGKWALVGLTYDAESHELMTYHNGRRVWSRTVILPEPYQSTGQFGKSTMGHKPFVGDIGRAQVFAKKLSKEEMLDHYRSGLTVDDQGQLSSLRLITERTDWLEDVGRQNLVFNANGQERSNANFSKFVYVEGDENDPHYFSRTSANSEVLIDEYIPVNGNGLDTFDRYGISCDIRGGITPSNYYFMIACFDRYKRWIQHQAVAMTSGTNTVLAQPLNIGDRWIYLNDASGWRDRAFENNSGYSSSYVHRTFCYWFNDPEVYVPYKYARYWRFYEDVDYPNNRIELSSSGWSGPSLPAGTPVMNSRRGSTYSYIGAVDHLTNLNAWESKIGFGTRSPSINGTRYGTSFIRVGWLMNREVGQARTDVRNVRCWNADRPQSQPIGKLPVSLVNGDTLRLSYLNEEIGGVLSSSIGKDNISSDKFNEVPLR